MKTFEVRFSTAAERELLSIWDHIAERLSVEAADTFEQGIRAECMALSVVPQRGLQQRYKSLKVRVIGAAQGRVSLAFQVQQNAVVIVAAKYRGRQS